MFQLFWHGYNEFMINPTSTVVFILLLSGILSIFSMGVIWRSRRDLPGLRALMLFQSGVAFWAITYAMHWIETSPQGKSLWLDMTYIGVVVSPPALLVFILKFLGRTQHRKDSIYRWLIIEPVITIILLFTDPLHNLFYGGLRDPMQSQIYNGGIWFWANILYIYVLILGTLAFVIVTILRASSVFKRQARIILIGISLPILANLFVFFGLNPFVGLDLTPIAMSITGLIMTVAVYASRLFDLAPIGREILVERMQEGMLLWDNQNRLIDINPAARNLLGIENDIQPGADMTTFLDRFTELQRIKDTATQNPLQVISMEDGNKYIEVKAENISDVNIGLMGTLIVCSDISIRVQMEKQQQEQYKEILALQEILSEQVIRDPLTDLYNRRYLMETLPAEISQASRADYPLSVVMLDLDHFKKLNDTYGHSAGDKVLVELGKYLRSNTRVSDIVVRYGGEEFLIVLLNTNGSTAFTQVERWRTEFSQQVIEYDSVSLKCEFSGGIASYPDDGLHADELIQKADMALYKAKAAGRNCIYKYSIL